MNKINFLLIFLFISAQCISQQIDDSTAAEKYNIVKINLSAFAFKNVSLQYERKVGNRTSMALNVHFIPFSKLPYQNSFKDITENTDIQYDKFMLGSLGFVPEFRYYLEKKGALHGFYIGAFINYTHYKMNVPITYSFNTKTGIFNGDINTITGGIQFGAQFKLGKNITLDWWIIGPNYGSANGALNFAGNLTQSEQDDLKSQLQDLKNDAPFFKVVKSYTVNSTGANIIAKGPWGGIRALGLSLGFIF